MQFKIVLTSNCIAGHWLPGLRHVSNAQTRQIPRDQRLLLRIWPLNSHRPVKQRRALLESTPPRDNWTERRRNKTVSTFGEVQTSPKPKTETFISEPEHAFQNSSKTQFRACRFLEALAAAKSLDSFAHNSSNLTHKSCYRPIYFSHLFEGVLGGFFDFADRGLASSNS